MNKSQAKDLVTEVVDVLKEADVPRELWPTAFNNLWLDMKSGGSASSPAGTEVPTPPPGSPYAELSKKANVNVKLLTDLYALEDGVLVVRAPARLLPPGKSAATIELALLVCAGREASGQEQTPTEAIRAVCSHYSKYDSANFASTLTSADVYWQISGKGQKRSYKLRAPGWDKAGEVLQRLAGQA